MYDPLDYKTFKIEELDNTINKIMNDYCIISKELKPIKESLKDILSFGYDIKDYFI